MRDLKDWPVHRVSRNVVRGGVFGIFHLIAEDQEVVFDVAEASGRLLSRGGRSDGWHGFMSCGRKRWCEVLRDELLYSWKEAVATKCGVVVLRSSRLQDSVAGQRQLAPKIFLSLAYLNGSEHAKPYPSFTT